MLDPMKDASPRTEELHSPFSFVALTCLTGGLYLTWWQYRLWRCMRERFGVPVSPLARAGINTFFPIFTLSMFVLPMSLASKRGWKADFSPLLFSSAYILFFFAPALFPDRPLLMGAISLMRAIPCLQLIPVMRVLLESSDGPVEEVALLSRSDVVVLLASTALNLGFALLMGAFGAGLLGG